MTTPTHWFVHVAAEYYAETHIVEANDADEAATLARELTYGNTYVRYPDDEPSAEWASHTTPACAVARLDDVTFVGTASRIADLKDERVEA